MEILGGAEDGVLLWQVAVEFVAASRKLASQGFTAVHAWARLHEFRDLLLLVMPSARVFEIAQPLHQEKGISFWDAMVTRRASIAASIRSIQRTFRRSTWARP